MQSVVLQIKLLFLSMYKRTGILHLQAKYHVVQKASSPLGLPPVLSTLPFFTPDLPVNCCFWREKREPHEAVVSFLTALWFCWLKATSCLLVSHQHNQNADTEWIFDAMRQQRTSNTKLPVSEEASLCKECFSYGSFPPARWCYRFISQLSVVQCSSGIS